MVMEILMETIQAIRYKMRMMVVLISSPSYIYGDIMSVIHNTQCHKSTLKKKSNYICCHAIHESVAMGEYLTGHVVTNKHCTELTTKVLYDGNRRFMC